MCFMLITFIFNYVLMPLYIWFYCIIYYAIKPPGTADKKLLVWLNLAYFRVKFKRSCQF